MKMFVYGTLQSGHGNNSYCLNGAKSLGPAVTNKGYVLVGVGFPKAHTQGNEEDMKPVLGEVFEVNEHHLSACDALEGHPDWYRRNDIKATLLSGEIVDCMIYEMNDPPMQDTCPLVNVNGSVVYKWRG